MGGSVYGKLHIHANAANSLLNVKSTSTHMYVPGRHSSLQTVLSNQEITELPSTRYRRLTAMLKAESGED